MFYEKKTEFDTLRQGDVLEGYIKISPKIIRPLNSENFNSYTFQINNSFAKYSVIITQCCSIKDKTISLAPLHIIEPNIINNPELIKDCRQLNEPIEKYRLIHPQVYNKMPEQEKEKINSFGKEYQYNNLFFYEQNEILPKYKVKFVKTDEEINTSSYYIDFNEIYQLNCDSIQKDNFGVEILKSKKLELTIEGRNELRQKLFNFFCRVPKEDNI